MFTALVSALALAAVVSVDAAILGRGGARARRERREEADKEAKAKAKFPLFAPTVNNPLSGGSSSQSLATEFRRGIRRQTLDALDARGQSITIMVVGDSGVGKSSLLSNLFHQELDDSPERGPTLRVTERVLKFDLGGVPFSALLIDSPGYHDSLNLGRSIKLVTDHIDSMFATTLANERRPHRKPESERETHLGVDVVLYFFSNPNPNPNPNQVLVRDDGEPMEPCAEGGMGALERYRQIAAGLSARGETGAAGMDGVAVLRNSLPVWNDTIGAFTLPFYSRAELPSKKNFHIVRPEAPDDILLLFGKQSKAGNLTSFSLDFCRPLSALAAFGIALTAFGDSD